MSKNKLKHVVLNELHSYIKESNTQSDSVSSRFQVINLPEIVNPENVCLDEIWEQAKEMYPFNCKSN